MSDKIPGSKELLVLETHPVQYRAPLYRMLSQDYGLPIHVLYMGRQGLDEYYDVEFGVKLKWSSDLLTGYSSEFVFENPPRSRIAAYWKILIHLIRRCRSNPDVCILFTGYVEPINVIARLIGFFIRRKMLIRSESSDAAKERSFAVWLLRRIYLKIFYFRIEHFLYIGKNSREHYLNLNVPENKLTQSPYSIFTSSGIPDAFSDKMKAKSAFLKKHGLKDNQILLLYSGKLVSRKGPENILKAVSRLSRSLQSRISLIYMGDGVLRSDLEQSAKSCDFHTEFVGFQNQDQIVEYYLVADCLIVPSLQKETWGLVVNEATTFGVYAIVSDRVGCSSDLVVPGITGAVYPYQSIVDLSKEIQNFAENTVPEEVFNGCKKHIQGFSPKRTADAIAEVYHSISGETE